MHACAHVYVWEEGRRMEERRDRDRGIIISTEGSVMPQNSLLRNITTVQTEGNGERIELSH